MTHPRPEGLLPCPFCGASKAELSEIEHRYSSGQNTWLVYCPCGASMEADREEDAANAWNTRPSSPPVEPEQGDRR